MYWSPGKSLGFWLLEDNVHPGAPSLSWGNTQGRWHWRGKGGNLSSAVSHLKAVRPFRHSPPPYLPFCRPVTRVVFLKPWFITKLSPNWPDLLTSCSPRFPARQKCPTSAKTSYVWQQCNAYWGQKEWYLTLFIVFSVISVYFLTLFSRWTLTHPSKPSSNANHLITLIPPYHDYSLPHLSSHPAYKMLKGSTYSATCIHLWTEGLAEYLALQKCVLNTCMNQYIKTCMNDERTT